MSDANFNLKDRAPARLPTNVLEVTTLADLPAAVGGFRDFGFDEALFIKAPIVDTQVWRWPDGSTISIEAENPNSASVTYLGITEFLQCLGQCQGLNLDKAILLANPAAPAKVFDLTADVRTQTIVRIVDTFFIGFSQGAKLRNFNGGVVRGFRLLFNQESFAFENCSVFSFEGLQMQGNGLLKQSLLSSFGPFTLQARMGNINWATAGTQSGIDFGPNIPPFAPISAVDTAQSGVGTYFKPLTNVDYTSVSNSAIVQTIIDVTADIFPGGPPTGFANFQTVTLPAVGDTITHSFTSGGVYDGTFYVSRVAGGRYQVAPFTVIPMAPIAFSGDSAGTMDVPIAEFITTDTSQLRVGHGININGAVYNGLFTVKAIDPNVSFTVSAPNLGTGTGSFDTFSLDETDSQINIVRAGNQKESMIAGGWRLVSNFLFTNITSGSFVFINFANVLSLSFNERISIFNTNTGSIKYDGLVSQVLRVAIEFLMAAEGNQSRTYAFKLVKSDDGGSTFIDFPDIIESNIVVSGNVDEVVFSTFRDVLVNPGEILRYDVSGIDTTMRFSALQGFMSVGKA